MTTENTPNSPTTAELIAALKAAGISKWRIAKATGVSWQTVHMWDKGIFEARDEYRQRLLALLT